MQPLAFSLQFGGPSMFARAKFFDLFRINVVRHVNRNCDVKQHNLSPILVLCPIASYDSGSAEQLSSRLADTLTLMPG